MKAGPEKMKIGQEETKADMTVGLQKIEVVKSSWKQIGQIDWKQPPPRVGIVKRTDCLTLCSFLLPTP